MVLREVGQHDLQSQEQSSVSVAPEWRPDSAPEVLHQQVQRSLLLYQVCYGKGRFPRSWRSGSWYGAWRRVSCTGHTVRRRGSSSGDKFERLGVRIIIIILFRSAWKASGCYLQVQRLVKMLICWKSCWWADKRLGLSFQFYFQTFIQHDFCSIWFKLHPLFSKLYFFWILDFILNQQLLRWYNDKLNTFQLRKIQILHSLLQDFEVILSSSKITK